MSAAHLQMLERKHEHLQARIREEMKHPASNDHRLREFKREKLHVREEIARLRGELH